MDYAPSREDDGNAGPWANNSRGRRSVSKRPSRDAGVEFNRTSVKPLIEVTSKIVS
jgi:hypothetical protein